MIRHMGLLVMLLGLAACATGTSSTTTDNGLIRIKSNASVEVTVKRLQRALDKAGMKQFGLIDHAAGASAIGQALRPTQVVIFGNPKAGTPLMRCAQEVAIDLPMKALIYQDANGDVWYAYNGADYLDQRHNLSGCETPIARITGALARFADIAAGRTTP
ncbi:MAG: DUF302 domain-containing protein [Pseudomonadota bacterium]